MDFETFKKQYNYENLSPILKQFLDIKFQHLDCLLFFRIGDFYELFYEDAIYTSKALGLALTSKGKNAETSAPMCGLPCNTLEIYLNKLSSLGLKVAICEQDNKSQDRIKDKSLIERKVVRIVTPGTILEESLVQQDKPNYLASIIIINKKAAICYADLTTGELNLTQVSKNQLINALGAIAPKEVLISDKLANIQ